VAQLRRDTDNGSEKQSFGRKRQNYLDITKLDIDRVRLNAKGLDGKRRPLVRWPSQERKLRK
jgi:hypothetical protein